MTTSSVQSRATSPAPARPARAVCSAWLKRNEPRWLPLVTIVVLIGLWELLGRTMHWNPLFFSYPSQIWSGFLQLAHGPLLADLRVSGTEFLVGMLISVGIALPVGLIMGMSRHLYWAFDPIIGALYSTPILVLAPMLVIWFGLGIASKIAIVVILSTFPVMINLTEGVRNTDRLLIRAARSFGARPWNLYRDVVLPSVTPFFITGLRLAVGRAMIGVVVGEYIASTRGIGYQINADAELFATPRYLAGVGVIVVFSVLVMSLLKLLEKRMAPWRSLQHARD